MLIGCLTKTGQGHYLKVSAQSHILFSKVIFHKKNSQQLPQSPSPEALPKICARNFLTSPRWHSFFLWFLRFKMWTWKLSPEQKMGADAVLILLIYARIMKRYLLEFIWDNLRNSMVVNRSKKLILAAGSENWTHKLRLIWNSSCWLEESLSKIVQ